MVQITLMQLSEAMQNKAEQAAAALNIPDYAGPGTLSEHEQAVSRFSRLYEECAQEYCDIHGLRYEVGLMSPIVIEGPAETAADVLADIADLFDAKTGRY